MRDMGVYVCRVDHDRCSSKTQNQRLIMIGKHYIAHGVYGYQNLVITYFKYMQCTHVTEELSASSLIDLIVV